MRKIKDKYDGIANNIVEEWRKTLKINIQRDLYGDSMYELKDLIEKALREEKGVGK